MVEEIWKRLAAFTVSFFDVVMLPIDIIGKILNDKWE